MKIGFDISQTGKSKAGCGYFAESLIRAMTALDLEDEFILYPTFGDVFWDASWPTTTCQIHRPNVRRGLGHATRDGVRAFWRDPPVDYEAQLGFPDIVHANNFFCPTHLKRAKLVYTLHDLAFVEYPEWTTEANRVGCFTGVFNASLFADLVTAVSEHSRESFLRIFPHYPPDRVRVVPGASRFTDAAAVARPEGLVRLEAQRFWLSVGTLEPRKNHHRLLQAYARLKAQKHDPLPLVLVGPRGWLLDDFEKIIDALGLRSDVWVLGYVEDSTLQWLYQQCYAFVYPSLFEGFGLPVLEAMSQGAAVIASNTPALVEIVNSAGLLVDPFQPEAIYDAMACLSADPERRASLSVQGRGQATRYSWKQTGQQLLDIYRSLL